MRLLPIADIPTQIESGLSRIWHHQTHRINWLQDTRRSVPLIRRLSRTPASSARQIGKCVKKLRSGASPEQVFEEAVNGTAWANRVCKLSAESILRGKSYSKTIPALVKVSGESLDSVVLQYKLVVDALLKRSRQIQQASAQVGISAAGLPSLSFPCVLVTEPQKRTMYDRLTKVDLAATNNATALLNTGDLIYSYNGEMVNSIECLQGLVAAGDQAKNAKVGVLRLIRTSNPHPLTGMAAEHSWQALQFEIPGGTVEAGLENFGQPT